MLRICVLLLLFISRPAFTDTSWFFKLVVLRFGHEEMVAASQGKVEIGAVASDRFYHIQGTIPLITGEFLELRFLEDEALSQLLQDKKATENPMRLKPYPYPQPEETEFFMVGAILNLMFQYPTLITYITGRNYENGHFVRSR